jgi:hypothetical protein
MLAYLTMEHELAFAVTTRSAKWTASNMLTTITMNDFCQQLMTEMKNEMNKILAAVTTAAKMSTDNRGCGTGGGGTGAVGTGGNTGRRHGRKNGRNFPLSPHCGKNRMHKPDNCFA